jgi:hypothetical protein
VGDESQGGETAQLIEILKAKPGEWLELNEPGLHADDSEEPVGRGVLQFFAHDPFEPFSAMQMDEKLFRGLNAPLQVHVARLFLSNQACFDLLFSLGEGESRPFGMADGLQSGCAADLG